MNGQRGMKGGGDIHLVMLLLTQNCFFKIGWGDSNIIVLLNAYLFWSHSVWLKTMTVAYLSPNYLLFIYIMPLNQDIQQVKYDYVCLFICLKNQHTCVSSIVSLAACLFVSMWC